METAAGRLPAVLHPGWGQEFPWLVQGTTTASGQEGTLDFALDGGPAARPQRPEAWRTLVGGTSMDTAVVAPQIHGAEVGWVEAGRVEAGRVEAGRVEAGRVEVGDDDPPPLRVTDPRDGHATSTPGVLLAVTVADCVPVFIVDPERRKVALLHAGWRGAAAGVLEAGLGLLEARGCSTGDLRLHLGPSICGSCYEVGPEVFRALGLGDRDGPAPLDLRAVLAARAASCGVPASSISRSAHCTLCGSAGFHSHRGGSAGRQVGFLGLRR